MEKKKLGGLLEVPAMGLGCAGMTGLYGVPDDAESMRTIHRALELGVNFLDTADIYAAGRNEELIGRAIQGIRDQVILASKFGFLTDNRGAIIGVNGRPEHVKACCEASLRRLGVETIDLYYQHRVDANVPIEETIGAMAELVREGKVRYLGLSEAAAGTIRRAHKVHPICAVQSEYSLWSRDVEEDILPTCQELGIGFVPYSPLGRGFLSGDIKRFEDFPANDYRRTNPRYQGENFQKNLAVVEKIVALAREKGCSPSQLALAWVFAQNPEFVPIPGTKRRKYLEQNIAALDIHLSTADLEQIEAAAPKGFAAGNRYPPHTMGLINQ